MRPDEAARWKNEVLDAVFCALAADNATRGMLVFKGARVLAMRLGSTKRQSLDIACNLRPDELEKLISKDALVRKLEQTIGAALHKHFAGRPVQRFKLSGIRVSKKPPQRDHPHGWDGYQVRLNVIDLKQPKVLAPPRLQIDIAHPEEVGPEAIADLEVAGYKVAAYTLERQTAEKLRAFLQSLPTWRNKFPRQVGAMHRPGSIRARDIFDLACIVREKPVSKNGGFWTAVSKEFVIACRAREVSCSGLSSFEEVLEETAAQYEGDPALQDQIQFADAWNSMKEIVGFLEASGILPISRGAQSNCRRGP